MRKGLHQMLDGVWVYRLPSCSYVHDGAYGLDSHKASNDVVYLNELSQSN